MKNPKFILPHQKKNSPISQAQIEYISDYFSKSIQFNPKDEKLLFGLPNPYIVPDYRHFREFFYWDSFYIFIGLLVYDDTKEFCKGILENFAYELKKFGRIPNSNTYFSLSRSQPPYFALALWDYLKKYPKDKAERWVIECVDLCIKEYEEYWMATDKRYADHKTENGLSRYWDLNSDFDGLSVYESGWDMSSRFNQGCMTLNPIDLNSQLYIYEEFFTWFFSKQKKKDLAEKWKSRMDKRVRLINKYCWDEKKGMYFDYHFVNKKTTGFISAASFFPFFAGFADKKKAAICLPALLKKLEFGGGIAITEKVPLSASKINQWDYPHGWAPLNYIAYHALMNYGFKNEAQRIKRNWMRLCDYWFDKDKCFYEKYNVLKIGDKTPCITPSRPGFGWTNGIYLSFLFDEN